MVVVEITQDMIVEYNKGAIVPIYDDENINLGITSDRPSTRSKRDTKGKKIGVYLLSPQDKTAQNKGEALFYDGATKVYFKLVEGAKW